MHVVCVSSLCVVAVVVSRGAVGWAFAKNYFSDEHDVMH